MALAWL